MNRKTKPILTEWETQLLKIIWDQKEATSTSIREELERQGFKRSDSAIRKTLRVMEEKDAIQHKVQERTFIYSPVLDQQTAEKRGIEYLSQLLFGGSPASLALRALDEADLTPDMIKAIRKKLGRKSK